MCVNFVFEERNTTRVCESVRVVFYLSLVTFCAGVDGTVPDRLLELVALLSLELLRISFADVDFRSGEAKNRTRHKAAAFSIAERNSAERVAPNGV